MDLKTSSQKVNHDKITAFYWPGWGGGNKSHGFHGGREKGGEIKKLTANERGGGRIIIILQHLRGGTR